MDARTGRGEPHGRPATKGRRIVRASCLHDGAALVAGRAESLFEKGLRDPVGVMVGVDDQEIDGADETARSNGRTQGQDGPAHDAAVRLGDEDAGLRQVDQLTEQIRGVEWAGVTVDTKVRVAQRDETIDIRDTGGSDQVFHAEGRYLAGRRPSPLDRGSFRPEVGTGARDPFAVVHRARSRGAADRYCNQVAGAYDTASFRRPPARRSDTVLRPRPSRTAARPRRRPGRAPPSGR